MGKVTVEEINDLLAASEIEVRTVFDKVTVVTCKLSNGFVLTESCGAVSAENYDVEIGKAICLERIENKLWELEGYALAKDIHAIREKLKGLRMRDKKFSKYFSENGLEKKPHDENATDELVDYSGLGHRETRRRRIRKKLSETADCAGKTVQELIYRGKKQLTEQEKAIRQEKRKNAKHASQEQIRAIGKRQLNRTRSQNGQDKVED
jgi:hypothetical protein